MRFDLQRESSAPSRELASRILYVSAASPVPSKLGPARRNYHILDQLARFYDVTLLSLGSTGEAALFAEEWSTRVPAAHFVERRLTARRKIVRKVWQTALNRCDFIPVVEPLLRQHCGSISRSTSFDAVVLSSVLLQGLPLPPNVPVVGDTHNVEFDVLRRTATSADTWLWRQYARRQWRATHREECRAARGVDLLVATSERDRQVFEQEIGVSDIAVVPNGIDLVEFSPVAGWGTPGSILFSGLMSYYPNQQAIRWFLDDVFPAVLKRVPGAKLTVAGAAPPRWLLDRANQQVLVTGQVPDMRPYLAAASVFVAPLMIGGGTRVKILEAQATGRPVVSTSIGAEGLEVRHGESILIADDADTFATHVADVLSHPGLAATVADGGLRYVHDHHNWDHIGERLGRLLRSRFGLSVRAGTLRDTPT